MKPPALDPERASEIAIEALGFLAEDEDRLGGFLSLTGLRLDTIRQAAASERFLASVLDHVMRDEAMLLAFSSARRLPPESVAAAHRTLDPAAESF